MAQRGKGQVITLNSCSRYVFSYGASQTSQLMLEVSQRLQSGGVVCPVADMLWFKCACPDTFGHPPKSTLSYLASPWCILIPRKV